MVMSPMDVVKQTGKTIIFEEFNKDREDLAVLLTRDDEEISLEKFKDALMGEDSELLVRSFDEFVEKFAPTIYETVVKTDNGAQFVYELEKPRYECTEVSLKDHAFYKMILALMNRKASTDKGNLAFPYDDLKKALTPEAEVEECKRIRKNLISNTKEYMRLTANGEPSAEADRFSDNIMVCRDKIISKYKDKSPLALLPLLIADRQQQIDKLNVAQENNQAAIGTSSPIPCQYSLDEKGNLELIEMTVSDDSDDGVENNEDNTQLIGALKEDFHDCAPVAIRENEYVTNLIVNVFAPEGKAQLTVAAREELELEKKQYQDVYKSSLESFAKAVAAVVEKFIGVKTFFDHAMCDGELPKDVAVIIANCKVDVILNDAQARDRFKKYFGGLSAEKDINKIWFGIIPAIAYEPDEARSHVKRERTDPFAKRTAAMPTSSKSKNGLVNLETAKEMLSLLSEVKIMTFVNYKASESTGFVELTAKNVTQYRRDFESVNSEYAVFTYPNFTILPKEKNAVKIGTEYVAEEQKEKNAYVIIPGIYLDSAYVAAGMMVGIQNYKYLQSKGYKVNSKYPCVRFDIEEGDNSKRIVTKLNRETTTEMEKKTKDAIMESRFGFVFADNKIIYDGKALNNSYVLNARTLKRDKNGNYKSLYKTLVRNLVDQILRASSDYVTEKSVQEFINNYANSWKRDNKDEEKKYANRILLEGETIDFDQEKHKLVVKFNKDEEVWDDIEINDVESEEK